MADEKPQPQGPGGGWISQGLRMIGEKPLPWIFALLGIAAVLYPLVASAPAFAKYEPSNPIFPVLAGMFSLFAAAVMWAVQYFTTIQSAKEKRKSARFFMWFLTGSVLIVGLAFALVPGLRSTQMRDIADPVLLALLMASWGGLLPVYWTATLLEDLPSKLEGRLEAIQNIENTVVERVNQQLARLDTREKELVNHVEDATRSLLPGFTKVFQKALWMLRNAERELCMVNFAVGLTYCSLFGARVESLTNCI
jgi:hypothetical protein